MVGKNCFAIASDRRLGVQFQTIATDYQRIFKIHDKLYIGLSGLGTDVQTLWVFGECEPESSFRVFDKLLDRLAFRRKEICKLKSSDS